MPKKKSTLPKEMFVVLDGDDPRENLDGIQPSLNAAEDEGASMLDGNDGYTDADTVTIYKLVPVLRLRKPAPIREVLSV